MISIVPNFRLDQNIVLISSLLRNSKENAENLLISTIEATYSTEFPPNFSKFPKNYHPNTLVRLIDSSIALVFMLFIFVFVNHFRKNYVGFKYPLSFSTK